MESKVVSNETKSTAKSVTFENGGATVSISRNTIGATGDTTAVQIDFNVSNPKKGDQYQIVIPKGTYGIGTDGQNIQASGTTTIVEKNDNRIITNTFTNDNAGTIHQQFTLNPGNNYSAQDIPIKNIGDVLKKITITKTDATGKSEEKELEFTQIVNPEMNPKFKRINPVAKSVRALPNTDYTYELQINETSGVAKGWKNNPSGKINSAVNTDATITIPVPDSFVLNQDRTYTVNNFGDHTTITQIGGRGGDIVIHVPKGSGRQNWNNGSSGYKIVGHYAVSQPVEDTAIKADKTIHIDQTITKADGSTYHIIKDLDQPWTETLLGSHSNNEVPEITLSADVYAGSHQIPQDVDPSKPINIFGFHNTTNQDITTAQITLTFPDGLNINRLDTPYDPVNLPGTTSYAYKVTYTDGQTGSGTIQAGQSLKTADNQGIAKIVITPNVISSGVEFKGDNRIKAYGTVNKTLKDGTPIKDGYEFDSTIAFVYSGLIEGNTYGWVFAGPVDARQNLAEPTASVGTYSNQSKRMPSDTDAGYISVYSNANGDATSHSVFEPVFYYVLPEGTVYTGKFDQKGQQPKITHFTVDGQEVVKLDYTGTGYVLDTTAGHNNDVHITNLPLAEIGSHKWAIYMYSPHIKMLNTAVKDYAGWTTAQTEGKSDNIYVLGDGNWTISTAQQVNIASGIKGPNDAFVVDNTTADDKKPGSIEYDFRVNNNLQKVSNGVVVININDGADNNFDFTMTKPVAVSNDAEVLYSTTELADDNKTTGHVPNLNNYVAWDQIQDKFKIKSVAIKFSSLDKGSNTSTFKIIGTDNNFMADAGKSVTFKPTLYSSDLKPLDGKTSTIKIAGKSTVKVELVDSDGKVINDVDLSHLNHTYEDNVNTMNQHDFALSDSDKQAIKNNDPEKEVAKFGQLVKYYFDGDAVQYKITKKQIKRESQTGTPTTTDKPEDHIGVSGDPTTTDKPEFKIPAAPNVPDEPDNSNQDKPGESTPPKSESTPSDNTPPSETPDSPIDSVPQAEESAKHGTVKPEKKPTKFIPSKTKSNKKARFEMVSPARDAEVSRNNVRPLAAAEKGQAVELPQTGSSNNDHTLVASILLGLGTTMLASLGFKKRKDN
ncbi:LPXTG cell wall anchor domain-containing protein [Lactobacillus xujianguonis]|uniref:LPXTG cell wall anchor domain-containing protein n=1 Tax=Lactobacillus xujianguonis TaxID=2495899 RepID=A0A437SSN4_9LACO|nr:LPXTG cell wall anchor domain-containing protein [Lactobacillus xujianguonis]RVU69956.1 LPXTG cell wall anchor domain-containing protein [Lactobacillus xujianguonis]RVU72343.1 LPXTG cell wall anchor domain-containing protein [Lactobacillus xujianguonis]